MDPEAERDDEPQGNDDAPSPAAEDRAARTRPDKAKRQRGTPKGASVPGKAAAAVMPGGRLTEVLSPAEARHFIVAVDTAIAGLLASDFRVDERDSRVAASGDALSDISRWLPIVRLAPRVTAPMILVGTQVSMIRDIVEAAPDDAWWRRRQRQEPAWEPEVVPGYGRVA